MLFKDRKACLLNMNADYRAECSQQYGKRYLITQWGQMRKKAIDLKSFSVDELITIRERVDALIESRVDTERRELETRLKRLQKFRPPADARKESKETTVRKADKKAKKSAAGRKAGRSTLGTKVPPKFRNPDNSAEAWSGRGLQPRWLRAAITTGKSIEDFRI